MEFLRNQYLHFALQNFYVYLLENKFLSALKKKKSVSPVTLTFCELSSCRFIA